MGRARRQVPGALAALCLWFLGAWAGPGALAVVDTAGLTRVDPAPVSVQVGRGFFNRRTGELTYQATLTNTGADALTGTLYLVVSDITPDTVALNSVPDDTTTGGDPAFLVLDAATLAPGESASVPLAFQPPARTRFSFQTAAFFAPAATDTTPPAVSITSPADGATVATAEIDVSGTVSEADASVVVNGVPAVVAGDGSFVATDVPLALGANTLAATATDPAGNSATASIEVTLDAAAPSVEITAPAAGTLLASLDPVIVSGTVDDPGATVTVNGVAAVVTPGSPSTFETVQGVAVREGRNVLTAVATGALGAVGTSSAEVSVDTRPPTVTIETPSDGAVLTSLQVEVAGLVNDIVTGTTINADDCEVRVNGQLAQVSNRAFLLSGLLLQRGRNTIEVEAVDRAGNSASTSIEVEVEDRAGQRIVVLAGNGQEAQIGAQLPEPLVVGLVDANGSPVAGQPVTFEVARGNGLLGLPGEPAGAEQITVRTDDNGIARADFALGLRVGAGNHRVRASAAGFIGAAEFCATALVGAPERVTPISGDMQTGEAERPLPLPMRVLVTDAGGNPVPGAEVEFTVQDGGGTIGGATTRTVVTDTDGLAAATLTLGPQQGVNNNVVTVDVAGLPPEASPATFVASGRIAGFAADTSVSGVVLDNQDQPVPGATVHVELIGQGSAGAPPEVITDDEGRFSIPNAPVGPVRLIVDGSTTPLPGRWPELEFDFVTVAGQDNQLEMPIWILPLSDSTVLIADGGPDQEQVLTLDGVPGSEIRIAPNSVACPQGQASCLVSWTQVRGGRVPMPPPNGSSFMLAWTLQPAGTSFDPPVSICIPNIQDPPGTQVEMYSFDHDLGEFVAIGTATVTDDGSQLCSDPGFGIVKSGWGGCAPPPPPRRCTISCEDNNECTNQTKQDPPCRCNTQKLSGNACGDRPGVNSCKKPGLCQDGICIAENKDDDASCDDALFCTKDDKCTGGKCEGTKVPDNTLSETEITLEPLNQALQRVQQFLNLMQIRGVTVPEFQGKLTFQRKEVCCEEKQGAMTLEEQGGGQLVLPLFEPPPFRPTIPPWSGDYTITVFGRSIGVAYGVEVKGSANANANLNRTTRECQDDVCWSGGVQIGAGVAAGLFGEVPNPALPPKCGPAKNMTCTVLSVSANAGSGLNAQASVGCGKITGQVGHNGLKFNAEFKALEGTFVSFSVTRSIVMVEPGPIGPLSIDLPL